MITEPEKVTEFIGWLEIMHNQWGNISGTMPFSQWLRLFHEEELSKWLR